jgi:hypothetical protein
MLKLQTKIVYSTVSNNARIKAKIYNQRENDVFSTLEELTIDCYNKYRFSQELCELWAMCMD